MLEFPLNAFELRFFGETAAQDSAGRSCGPAAAEQEQLAASLPPSLRHAFVFVSDRHYEGSLDALHDGSPSTEGVGGHYSGGWSNGKPHGLGLMQWSNGISFEGRWHHGQYEGWGIKAYSKGGGYAGMWRGGKRHVSGTRAVS